ncbi:MAG: hypothetical protein LBL64_01725, partial [Treponema sp.]|nr:hypothetical protein [Treponema sp.]
YKKGNIVHIDLVQWATQCPWSAVPKEAKEKLFEKSIRLFAALLNYRRFKAVFINGSGAFEAFYRYLPNIPNYYTINLDKLTAAKTAPCLYLCRYNETPVIGWNYFIGDDGKPGQLSEEADVKTFAALVNAKTKEKDIQEYIKIT